MSFRNEPQGCSVSHNNYCPTLTCTSFSACGHTVCEGCGEMLARQCDTYIPRIIKCPFDRKVTVLDNGGVRNLPKNYSILDDIDDHKNDES